MSLQNSDPRPLKWKRRLTGGSDIGQGSGGQDPGNVGMSKLSAPGHGVSSQGLEAT